MLKLISFSVFFCLLEQNLGFVVLSGKYESLDDNFHQLEKRDPQYTSPYIDDNPNLNSFEKRNSQYTSPYIDDNPNLNRLERRYPQYTSPYIDDNPNLNRLERRNPQYTSPYIDDNPNLNRLEKRNPQYVSPIIGSLSNVVTNDNRLEKRNPQYNPPQFLFDGVIDVPNFNDQLPPQPNSAYNFGPTFTSNPLNYLKTATRNVQTRSAQPGMQNAGTAETLAPPIVSTGEQIQPNIQSAPVITSAPLSKTNPSSATPSPQTPSVTMTPQLPNQNEISASPPSFSNTEAGFQQPQMNVNPTDNPTNIASQYTPMQTPTGPNQPVVSAASAASAQNVHVSSQNGGPPNVSGQAFAYTGTYDSQKDQRPIEQAVGVTYENPNGSPGQGTATIQAYDSRKDGFNGIPQSTPGMNGQQVPNTQFNNGQFAMPTSAQQLPTNYAQQTPTNYAQQIPTNYAQQIPTNYAQQIPPNYGQQAPITGQQMPVNDMGIQLPLNRNGQPTQVANYGQTPPYTSFNGYPAPTPVQAQAGLTPYPSANSMQQGSANTYPQGPFTQPLQQQMPGLYNQQQQLRPNQIPNFMSGPMGLVNSFMGMPFKFIDNLASSFGMSNGNNMDGASIFQPLMSIIPAGINFTASLARIPMQVINDVINAIKENIPSIDTASLARITLGTMQSAFMVPQQFVDRFQGFAANQQPVVVPNTIPEVRNGVTQAVYTNTPREIPNEILENTRDDLYDIVHNYIVEQQLPQNAAPFNVPPTSKQYITL